MKTRKVILINIPRILVTLRCAILGALVLVSPCFAQEIEKVVVPDKTTIEFWDRNTLVRRGEYPVGQMYYDGGGSLSSSAWGCLAGRALYDVGSGLVGISSPYSADEPAYGIKRTHHFFSGWQSRGRIINENELVDP